MGTGTTRCVTMRVIPALLALAWAGGAQAAAFQLLEQNASGIGNAYAGTAASAENASTVFFNPAGMAFLSSKRQVSLGLDAVKPTAKFSNGSTTPSFALPPSATLPTGRPNSVGGNGGDAGDWAFIPNFYLTVPINERLNFGLGVGAPFGLKTEYDNGWAGRYHALKSEVKTINLNPSISFKVNEKLAVGGGLNYQRFEAELTNAVNYGLVLASAAGNASTPAAVRAAIAPLAGTANLDGVGKVSGNDTGWGWNLGAMYQVSPDMRLGVAYRSAIKYHVTGTASFSTPATGNAAAQAVMATATADGPVKLDIKVPDSLTFSVAQRLDERWEMLGDLQWTGWAKIREIAIYRSDGTLLSKLDEQWRNTWRVALGANYKLNEKVKLRMGVAYDQTPVKNELRHPSLPDNDRTWLSFGVRYQLSPSSVIDAGYAHLFVKKASIHDDGGSTTNAVLKGTLDGSYKNSVDILGVQYTMSF